MDDRFSDREVDGSEEWPFTGAMVLWLNLTCVELIADAVEMDVKVEARAARLSEARVMLDRASVVVDDNILNKTVYLSMYWAGRSKHTPREGTRHYHCRLIPIPIAMIAGI